MWRPFSASMLLDIASLVLTASCAAFFAVATTTDVERHGRWLAQLSLLQARAASKAPVDVLLALVAAVFQCAPGQPRANHTQLRHAILDTTEKDNRFNGLQLLTIQ